MRHPLRILWLFAALGLALGCAVGFVRRESSQSEAPAHNSAWQDAATLAAISSCINPTPAPSQPTDDSTDGTELFGDINAKEEIACVLDGQPAAITTWPDPGTQASAMLAIQMFLPAFGVQFVLATGQGWWASLDSDKGDPRQMRRIAELFADRLDGNVVTVGPT